MAINYYILDTETTGTKHGYHEITQIAIIRASDRVQMNKYIKPQFLDRVSPDALTYTGRTMADLEKGGTKEEAVQLCNNFLKEDGADPEDRCIIGHNIFVFDKRFIHYLWGSVGETFPANLWLDTIPYTKAFIKAKGLTSKKYSLNIACELVGVTPKEGAHNAVSDTQNNYLLWEALKKEGVPSLPHIKRMAHVIE
jgi:DNA polymerase III epsilon subunit-like protein